MTSGSVSFSFDAELTRGDTITAFGTKEFLIDIAQQVSWLTASIRLPCSGQVSLSDSLLIRANVEGDVAIYKVFSLPLESVPVHEKETACWLPLFLGSVIARSYPIPEREQEQGLELPYDLMTTVAGNMVPQCHDGGIFLKGHSRLLYPVSGSILGSVQWHLLTSLSRRVSLPDDLICAQSWLRMLDRRLLSNVPRTFLGYCREVTVDLGTHKTAEYYAAISFSSAEDVFQGPRIQAPTSFTWGTSGMGIFGATLTHSIVYGKALAQTVAGDGDDYLDILDTALRTPIILYDDNLESQRGWMVSALSVILHMIHTWAANKNCIRDGLPCVTTTLRADDAARNVLEQNWNFIVRNSWDEEMSKKVTIKDLVMQFWHGIQKRNEDDLFARHRIEPGFELTSSKLYGWDYMDLVTGISSRKKQLNFNENWMDLTEDVMVLFGGGFGEVIKPASGVSICAEWNPIPSMKMYLTATIDCLQKLSRKRGGHSNHLTSSRLTNKSYWNHHTKDLFTDCNGCYSAISAKTINCPKVPQKLDSSVYKSNQELLAPLEGAIVFGSQPKKRKSRRSLRERVSKIIRVSHVSQVHMFPIVEPGLEITTCNLQNEYFENEDVPKEEVGSCRSASKRP